MGLDLVEIILAVEDKLQIDISDEEASEAVTVGMLHELIVGKVPVQDSQRCLTSTALYRVRRALVEVLGLARRQVRPDTRLDTRLDTLLPVDRRRERWARIQTAMQLQAPDLRHPLGTIMARSAVGLPDGMQTVGDLARDVLGRNHAALAEASGGWNSKQVYKILCDIIVEQVGVERSKITPGARLVDDLRIS